MDLRSFDQLHPRSNGNVFWHVDIFTNGNFSEKKLYEFYCGKDNIASCFKIYNVCDFSMDIAISAKEDFRRFQHELFESVPGIEFITRNTISYLLK